MKSKQYEIMYMLLKEGTMKIDLTEEDTIYIKVSDALAKQELKIEEFKLYINGIKEL